MAPRLRAGPAETRVQARLTVEWFNELRLYAKEIAMSRMNDPSSQGNMGGGGSSGAGGGTDQLRDKAAEVGQNLRDMGGQVRDAASEKYNQLRDQANQYYSQGRE